MTGGTQAQPGPPIYIYTQPQQAYDPNNPPAPASGEGESPSDEVAPDAPPTEDSAKRYLKIHQSYSELEMRWIDKIEVKLTKEEEEAAKKLLFTVRYRSLGPTDDAAEVLVDISSKPVVQVLKEILVECEELHEETPTLNAQHLFRHWAEFAPDLEARRKRADALKAGPSSSTDPSSSNDKEEDATVAALLSADDGVDASAVANTVDSSKSSKKTKVYTAEELERQIDEMQEVLACTS